MLEDYDQAYRTWKNRTVVLLLLVVGVASLYNSIYYKNNFSNNGMGLFRRWT